jgi:hypothetical protein
MATPETVGIFTALGIEPTDKNCLLLNARIRRVDVYQRR